MTLNGYDTEQRELIERRAEEYLPRIDKTKEPRQGHTETVEEGRYPEPIDYGIADAAIGDVQFWLKRFGKGNPLIADAFKRAFRFLARRRAELKKEAESA